MTSYRTVLLRSLRRAAWVAALVLASGGVADAQVQRLAGAVVSLEGTALTVATGAETQRLRLPDGARITARARTDWSAIGANSYVGTTAVPRPDGTLLAKEVHIFTEAQRGAGEGHRPMDTPGDTMTNATVASVVAGRPRDTMTNATVAGVADGGSGHRLKLVYPGGEQTVVVPDEVPIIASEPGDRTLLVPGATVVAYVRRDADGALVVERLSVGRNGFATPI